MSPRDQSKTYASGSFNAMSILAPNKPSGFGLGTAFKVMLPAPNAVKVRVKPELETLAPLTLYTNPVSRAARKPDFRVP